MSLLAVWARLGLTKNCPVFNPHRDTSFHMQSATRQTRGDAMSKHPKVTKPGRSVDTWAIFFIVVLAVGVAMFWVSGR
ncbi:hypothetical protein BW686_04740 [Pseudomonas syringae]|uniref:Uncharacterized protein n=1 Tax=Pseudomonas syringae TaxID=317 RepID=A0A244EVS1_PSESX|nr:hypothetical protein [Pseudomonas syringae]MCI3945450.1 hypothetical protein [Pseudomonas syringae]OUM08629.1 hypothetical protein BW686_04740 [Pseudomonas syringae]